MAEIMEADWPSELNFTLLEPEEDARLWFIYLAVSIFLSLMAGFASGLTLGLMSLDHVELEVLKRSGTNDEKYYASRIAPVVKHQHYLLVTLLLINALATEALPIFIDRLANPVMAVILSVIAILIFGEIIPQAICSRFGLQVGAYSATFVRFLMFLCWPVSYPVSKLLDWVLGSKHSALFRRAQLKALVDLHSVNAGLGGNLTQDEIHIISGALDMSLKTAEQSMTPINKVFMLSSEDRLDEQTMHAILKSGHSRIPVYREGNRRDIMGLILVKELVLIDPSDNLPITALTLRDLPSLSAATPMYDMFKLFKSGRSHMAMLMGGKNAGDEGHLGVVIHNAEEAEGDGSGLGHHHHSKKKAKEAKGEQGLEDTPLLAPTPTAGLEDLEPVGIITIEDVIEELLQEEIIDETDQYVDNLQQERVNMATLGGSLPPRLRQVLNTGLFTPRVGRISGTQDGAPPPLASPSVVDGNQSTATMAPHPNVEDAGPPAAVLLKPEGKADSEDQ